MKKKIIIYVTAAVLAVSLFLYVKHYQRERQGRLEEQQVTHDDCCMDPCDSIIPVTDSI